MNRNTVFIFSHAPQIKWFTVIARACREYFAGCRVVLFVHGRTDREYAERFPEYDEVVDLIAGFRHDGTSSAEGAALSPNILKLEKDLGQSFFWEDALVDRWIRARNNGQFTMRYLSHAFDILHAKYVEYRPVCGWGESTMAIYRFAHRLFERDGRPYLAAIGTRYYDRFYVENDWYWSWPEALANYRDFLRSGVPHKILEKVVPVYDHIAAKRGKPRAFENFAKLSSKGYEDLSLDFEKTCRVLKRLNSIDMREVRDNVRYSFIETSLRQKISRYRASQKNYKDYLRLSADKLPDGAKFCSYFLHYQPEYTVDSLGKYYADQNFLIANIASALPADHFLAVKEHAAMAGLRPKSFYEHIKKNGNVILLNHALDSAEVILRSSVVFTIVGTPALEAMFMGVPAVMFGKYAFNATNTISFAADFWGLSALIREKLREKHSPDGVKKHALALLAGKYAASYPGKIPTAETEIDGFVDEGGEFSRVKESIKTFLARKFPKDGVTTAPAP